jgi:hypothetical protein
MISQNVHLSCPNKITTKSKTKTENNNRPKILSSHQRKENESKANKRKSDIFLLTTSKSTKFLVLIKLS